MQSQPPASLVKAMVTAETGTKTKQKQKQNQNQKKKSEREDKVSSAASPRHSKAARRFYNENLRDSATRLSKVLAASGGTYPSKRCVFRILVSVY